MLHNIKIDSIEIGFDAANTLNQTYEDLGGRSLRRKLDGTAHLQTAWSKVRTVITGQGDVPEGLDGLDYTTTHTLYCAAPRSIASASNVITLPATRRSDWAPHGYAIVDGRQVRTAVSIATNTATLTTVSGATGYVCAYYPTLTVYLDPPRKTFAGRGPVIGWELTAEEA